MKWNWRLYQIFVFLSYLVSCQKLLLSDAYATALHPVDFDFKTLHCTITSSFSSLSPEFSPFMNPLFSIFCQRSIPVFSKSPTFPFPVSSHLAILFICCLRLIICEIWFNRGVVGIGWLLFWHFSLRVRLCFGWYPFASKFCRSFLGGSTEYYWWMIKLGKTGEEKWRNPHSTGAAVH